MFFGLIMCNKKKQLHNVSVAVYNYQKHMWTILIDKIFK